MELTQRARSVDLTVVDASPYRIPMKFFLLMIWLGFGAVSWGASLEGISFSDEIQVSKKRLVLNGLGLRTATIFNVRVYVAGLYLEKRASKVAEILGSSGLKKIDMRFFRDLKAKKLADAWAEAFEKNCTEPTCKGMQGNLDRMKQSMPDVKEGDHLSITFFPSRMAIDHNDKRISVVKGARFSKTALLFWIGVPPNEALRTGLLNLKK